jgi:protein Tob/BTG
MREEIEAAVCFVGRIISASNEAISANVTSFKESLSKGLADRFKGHWHETSPGKGQGYRSIRIHPNEPVDPVLQAAAKDSKFSLMHIQIPVEFTLWIDPKDVSCR